MEEGRPRKAIEEGREDSVDADTGLQLWQCRQQHIQRASMELVRKTLHMHIQMASVHCNLEDSVSPIA